MLCALCFILSFLGFHIEYYQRSRNFSRPSKSRTLTTREGKYFRYDKSHFHFYHYRI